MQSLEIIARFLAGLGLVLANGFFVTIEFGLTRARQYPESAFVEEGVTGLERAWAMTEELEIYLTGCQVGITAASISLGIVAEPALAAILKPLFAGTVLASIGAGVFLAYLIVNLVHVVYGEQTPTYLGVERSQQVCRYGATPLYWFTRVIRPILDLGDAVAKWTLKLFGVEMTGAWLESEADVIEGRADLHRRLGSVLDEGNLPEERYEEVMNALAVGEMPISNVMVEREEIAALSTANTPEENLAVVEDSPHLRFPLFDDGSLRGIVYLASLTNRFEEFRDGEVAIEDLATEPMTLPADEEVSDAVDRFQEENQELALVTDGEEIVGLLTATDAFEEVMGDLEDPLDVYQRAREREGTPGPGGDPA